MEAASLGLFMIAAFTFGAILEHPGSPVRQTVSNPLSRRFLMGVAMGATAVAIIYSPWGKQSGAHINPSTTFTFYRLGKITRSDAFFYIVCQFTGGLAGAIVATSLFTDWAAHPSVNYVITAPGGSGVIIAFTAELAITFILMTVILHVSNNVRWHKFTGVCAGALVAAYITIEAPLSGMSMNPARTLASAVPAQHWTALWIYFAAPITGMLCAAELYLRTNGARSIGCAKLHHDNPKRCIFCGKPAGQRQSS